MLKAVTFDFWNTLFVDTRGREREERRSAILRTAIDEAGLEASDRAIAESLQASWDHFERVWRSEHRTPPCAELVDAILVTLGARLPETDLERLIRRFERLVLELPPEPTPGAAYTVPTLAERYRLAVICDTGYTPGLVLREILEQNGLLAVFEYTYFSNEHGISKPDVRAFQHTLEEIDARPSEAAHIGDIQRTDIAGSQAAGMLAVHFVGANNHDAGSSTADVMIRHFDELPQALGGLICPGC